MKHCLPILALFVLSISPAVAQSDDERLRKLEKAVEQLQQRNAQLEAEVHELKTRPVKTAPMTRPQNAVSSPNDANQSRGTESQPTTGSPGSRDGWPTASA